MHNKHSVWWKCCESFADNKNKYTKLSRMRMRCICSSKISKKSMRNIVFLALVLLLFSLVILLIMRQHFWSWHSSRWWHYAHCAASRPHSLCFELTFPFILRPTWRCLSHVHSHVLLLFCHFRNFHRPGIAWHLAIKSICHPLPRL